MTGSSRPASRKHSLPQPQDNLNTTIDNTIYYGSAMDTFTSDLLDSDSIPSMSKGEHVPRNQLQKLKARPENSNRLSRLAGSLGFRDRNSVANTSSGLTDTELGEDSLRPWVPRQPTLLSVGATAERQAAELKNLLGDENSRIRTTHASSTPTDSTSQPNKPKVVLEQAKSRTRVDVDVALDGDTYVQGSYMRGLVRIYVRRPSRKDSPLLLGAAKLRVVGFECIPKSDKRHVFYQCGAFLTDITDPSQNFPLPSDTSRYVCAKEGIHVVPFALLLPLGDEKGIIKGPISVHGGVSIRYVVIASIKVKKESTGKQTIAHFYRQCNVWPRLDPSSVLTPAPRPLRASTAQSVVMGGPGKLELSAYLHRLSWIAGQQCSVRVSVGNGTRRAVQAVTFALMRTTILLHPSNVNMGGPERQSLQRQVAEDTLAMGDKATKGHASAKGWWAGVKPLESLDFSHSILLPPGAVSVEPSRLMEVNYSLRVSLQLGALTPDLHVDLPLRIVNFISLDPPLTSPLPPKVHKVHSSASEISTSLLQHRCDSSSRSNTSCRDFQGERSSSVNPDNDEEDGQRESGFIDMMTKDSQALASRENSHILLCANGARLENTRSFADLFLAEQQEANSATARRKARGLENTLPETLSSGTNNMTHKALQSPSKAAGRRPHSFAQRVERKLREAKQTPTSQPRVVSVHRHNEPVISRCATDHSSEYAESLLDFTHEGQNRQFSTASSDESRKCAATVDGLPKDQGFEHNIYGKMKQSSPMIVTASTGMPSISAFMHEHLARPSLQSAPVPRGIKEPLIASISSLRRELTNSRPAAMGSSVRAKVLELEQRAREVEADHSLY